MTSTENKSFAQASHLYHSSVNTFLHLLNRDFCISIENLLRRHGSESNPLRIQIYVLTHLFGQVQASVYTQISNANTFDFLQQNSLDMKRLPGAEPTPGTLTQ